MSSSGTAVLAGLVLVLCLGAAAVPAAAAEPAAAADSLEEQYELLAVELAVARAELIGEPEADEVLLIELEELEAVAEEILIEGDAETAVLLLEEALALLPVPGEE